MDTFLTANDQYLPSPPEKVLREGSFPQIPILTGISKPVSDPEYRKYLHVFIRLILNIQFAGEWLEYAKQGATKLQQYIEHKKIEEIIYRYNLNTDNKGYISDLIKWRFDVVNNIDAKMLFDNLKRMDIEARIEAPHFLQLNYLLSSYVQPIYVYYLDDMGFQVNVNDSFITSDLLLLFGPLLLNQVARRRFQPNEMRFSKHVKQLWTNFIIFGYFFFLP